MKKLILIIVVIISGVVIWKYYVNADKWQTAGNVPRKAVTNRSEKLEDASFAELTIPYLRDRTYASRLGELTEYGSNPQFKSYLTNYESDGNAVNGLLTIPQGKMPAGGWPGIVFVHGYIAPTIYLTTEKYQDYVNALARSGFVVFKIDLRGHGSSEGEPGGAYYSSDYVIDTLNARAALQDAEFVKDEAIGLWGHSMAGNVTFRAFVVAQDVPALVVWAGAGYSYDDLAKYGLNDNSYRPPSTSTERQRRREELRKLYGDYDPENEFWRQVTPINYLEGVSGAVQMHHADDDNVVNIGYSRDLNTVLKVNSIENELYEYRSGGHNLSGATFNTAMLRTIEFYRIHLK